MSILRRVPRAAVVERQRVLVTGASSGIGEATAVELAACGFRVFAGVRRALDGERIAALAGRRCTPLEIDVTDAASIAAAAATLHAAGGVYGVVNNAGIGIAAPLEYLPIDELRRQFEVNVVGALAVTQALLPQLRRSLGRVVNVGSIAGRSALPLGGPYCASKAALDLLTQSLRMELAPFDIGVSYIEPGSHRTPIWDRSRRGLDAMRAGLPGLGEDRYGASLDALRELMAAAEQHAGDPREVARAVARALQSPRPKARYTIGKDTRARLVLGLLPTGVKERAIAGRFAAAARS